MYTYTGKTALITGASGGIGEVFARELAQRGMHLILVARSEGALRKLATELSGQYGVRCEVVVADLSKEWASDQIKDVVTEKRLRVDMLINNAGFGTYDAFEKIDPERDHQQVMLNVAAVVDMAHTFLPEMVGRGEGAVINVSSMAAFQPMPYMAVYAASKAFVLRFSEALWGEYRERGIRVVALCPGQVETSFHDALENATPAAGVKSSPKEVVQAALQTLEKGKSWVLPGLLNYLSIQSIRFMPGTFLMQATANALRPQSLKSASTK